MADLSAFGVSARVGQPQLPSQLTAGTGLFQEGIHPALLGRECDTEQMNHGLAGSIR